MSVDVRLVAYAPNGDRLGLLPRPLSVEVAVPLDDVPSLRVSYAAGASGADLLAEPVEVAVETSDPTTGRWVEVDGGRFLRIKRSGTVTDATGTRSFELPGYAWMLRKARLFPSPHDNGEGKRPFLSATPGTILATLIGEAKARGALPGLALDFTATVDSAGATWSKILTISYEPGIDVLAVLDNLAEQGVVDWTMSGRTLRIYNADTVLGRDLAAGDAPVDLRLGRDITDAPDTGTLEEVASAVYVKGDGGTHLEITNPNAPTPWGRWETFVTHGGVRDEGTMRVLASAELERTGRERVQITRALTFTAARWLPFRDYRPGDYVRAPDDTGSLVPLRVRQITLTRDHTGALGGNLVLNDRFIERELRLARRTRGIVGGATADGGSGARPAPEGPDRRAPAAPQGLIVDTTAYLDSDGAARGQITATWGLVDQATDGTAIEVARYEVYQRPNIIGLPWSKLTETTHPDASATSSPYDVGTEWAVKVRALSRAGVYGTWSEPYAVTIAADTDAPPRPSAPVLSTRLGVIRVEWDGQGSQGEAMPGDFDRVDVWMETGATFWRETWDYQGQPDPQLWTVLGTDYTTPWGVTCRGGQLVVTGGGDILAARDTGTADYTVTARNLHTPTQTHSHVGVFARYSPGPNPTYPYMDRKISVRMGQDSDYVMYRVQYGPGEDDRRYQFVDLPPGSEPNRLDSLSLTVHGKTVTLAANGNVFHTDTLTDAEHAALTGTQAGVMLSTEHSSVGMVEVTAADAPASTRINQMEGPGAIVVTGQPYHAPRTFRFQAVDRSGNASPMSDPATITTQPLVAPDLVGTPITGDKIQANSITADNLAVGSVTASALAADAVTADTIAADAITAKHTLTGATVRTGRGFPRVQIDRDGLHAWNANGTRTANLSAETGAADLTGTLTTGTSGIRCVVTSRAWAGYPGVHFTGLAGSPDFEPTIHGREDGKLWLLSAEDTANSSGRAELILKKGGGWFLGAQFGNPDLPVSINAPGDGRIQINGILETGMGGTKLFGIGKTHVAPGYFSVRIDYWAFVKFWPLPIATIVTGAPQDGITYGVSRWDGNGFQFNWSKGAEIDIMWWVVRCTP
ncbi:hypothetical protein GCM10012275_39760 [Longimycelium tulufanense]|uniref:Fibronectin type-III domain-containing protein n=1 Tax=Longimycelium tulufanense TaxID=907463 RepID=A0A8J3CEZ9_9PSEU|nr:hypothetical protein [Longimycelium tulufanense]GGM65242.1 hypothetical protein GCM10012275_39760 [Longimycelium tulufanense]